MKKCDFSNLEIAVEKNVYAIGLEMQQDKRITKYEIIRPS